jgi:hypothetical protein
MHCEVSTLPATTAPGGAGSSSEPGGTTIVSGRRHPALRGIGSSISVRNTYSTAANVTARGAFKLLGCCAEVPVKSTTAAPASWSTWTLTTMAWPLSIS